MVKSLSLYYDKIKVSQPFVVLLFLAIVALSCAPKAPAPVTGEKSSEGSWLNIPLKDVGTEKTFKLSDFRGKVVVLETMAVWCTTCKRQQIEIRRSHSQLGEDTVSISLDIDPNENEQILRRYLQSNDFNWIFAVSPPEMSQQLVKLFGNNILNAPSTPIIILDKEQSAHPLRFGLKSSQELVQEIARYR